MIFIHRGSYFVVSMGIRVYIRNAVRGYRSDGQPEESGEDDLSSNSGEFIRRSIIQGGGSDSGTKESGRRGGETDSEGDRWGQQVETE